MIRGKYDALLPFFHEQARQLVQRSAWSARFGDKFCQWRAQPVKDTTGRPDQGYISFQEMRLLSRETTGQSQGGNGVAVLGEHFKISPPAREPPQGDGRRGGAEFAGVRGAV